jgi:hypothetical protein
MTTLIDRYVFAALRRVPDKQRADIDRELRAAIDDAVDARLASGEPHQAATENALLELGDPARLADGYADRRQYLIGPDLFPAWRRLLILLISVVLPIVVAVGVVLRLIEDDVSAGAVIGEAVGTTISMGAQLTFWSTAVFALLERTGAAHASLRGRPWTLADLPKYEPGALTTGQLAANLLWPVLLMVALILQQFTFGPVPVLDPGNWAFWWPLLIVVLLGKCGYAVWVYRRGAWTHKVTLVNAVLAILLAAPVAGLAAADRFFNPEFLARLHGDWHPRIVIAVAVLTAVWDIVEVAVRAERSRRGRPAAVAGSGDLPGTILRGKA